MLITQIFLSLDLGTFAKNRIEPAYHYSALRFLSLKYLIIYKKSFKTNNTVGFSFHARQKVVELHFNRINLSLKSLKGAMVVLVNKRWNLNKFIFLKLLCYALLTFNFSINCKLLVQVPLNIKSILRS